MRELVQFELTLPMAPEAELVAAGTTEQVAKYTGFDDHAIAEVRQAVIEACINAIFHSNSPDGRVYLTFVVGEDKLLVIVRDFGKGFDPTEVDPPSIQERISRLRPRGWGLTLIKKFMDHVEFHDLAPGTELRMTKYLTQPPRTPTPA